jgi:hypothetical protein
MHRYCSICAVAALLVSFASYAKAEAGPVPKGTFTLSGERLTGVMHVSETVSNPAPVGDRTTSVTTVSLLGSGIGAVNAFGTALGAPRVGFDGFIIDGLSLGGTLSFVSTSYNPDGPDNDMTLSAFSIAPRVGYAYMFTNVVGIWPRGGLSYIHESISPEDNNATSTSFHAFAFDVEAPLIITPVEHFSILVGPLFDVTFGGEQTATTRNNGVKVDVSRDDSLTQFGLAAGLMGTF